MDRIAQLIYWAATDFDNKADEIRAQVSDICRQFPLY